MKVIAAIAGYHTNEVSKVIVEMDAAEMKRIVNGCQYGQLHMREYQPGRVIEIGKRFDHAMAIEEQSRKATGITKILRSFADMLELQHPAIEQVVAPPAEEVECDE